MRVASGASRAASKEFVEYRTSLNRSGVWFRSDTELQTRLDRHRKWSFENREVKVSDGKKEVRGYSGDSVIKESIRDKHHERNPSANAGLTSPVATLKVQAGSSNSSQNRNSEYQNEHPNIQNCPVEVIENNPWICYSFNDFATLPPEVLEVMTCDKQGDCRHDHSRYRVIGDKIYMWKAELPHLQEISSITVSRTTNKITESLCSATTRVSELKKPTTSSKKIQCVTTGANTTEQQISSTRIRSNSILPDHKDIATEMSHENIADEHPAISLHDMSTQACIVPDTPSFSVTGAKTNQMPAGGFPATVQQPNVTLHLRQLDKATKETEPSGCPPAEVVASSRNLITSHLACTHTLVEDKCYMHRNELEQCLQCMGGDSVAWPQQTPTEGVQMTEMPSFLPPPTGYHVRRDVSPSEMCSKLRKNITINIPMSAKMSLKTSNGFDKKWDENQNTRRGKEVECVTDEAVLGKSQDKKGKDFSKKKKALKNENKDSKDTKKTRDKKKPKVMIIGKLNYNVSKNPESEVKTSSFNAYHLAKKRTKKGLYKQEVTSEESISNYFPLKQNTIFQYFKPQPADLSCKKTKVKTKSSKIRHNVNRDDNVKRSLKLTSNKSPEKVTKPVSGVDTNCNAGPNSGEQQSSNQITLEENYELIQTETEYTVEFSVKTSANDNPKPNTEDVCVKSSELGQVLNTSVNACVKDNSSDENEETKVNITPKQITNSQRMNTFVVNKEPVDAGCETYNEDTSSINLSDSVSNHEQDMPTNLGTNQHLRDGTVKRPTSSLCRSGDNGNDERIEEENDGCFNIEIIETCNDRMLKPNGAKLPYKYEETTGIGNSLNTRHLVVEHASPLQTITVVKEQTIPLVKEYDIRSVKEQDIPLVKEQYIPLVKEQATPLVKEQATPLVKEQATPLVKEQATPLVKEQATPLVKEQATPLVKEQATPFVKEQATPFVKEQAIPSVKEQTILSVKEIDETCISYSIFTEDSMPVEKTNEESSDNQDEPKLLSLSENLGACNTQQNNKCTEERIVRVEPISREFGDCKAVSEITIYTDDNTGSLAFFGSHDDKRKNTTIRKNNARKKTADMVSELSTSMEGSVDWDTEKNFVSNKDIIQKRNNAKKENRMHCDNSVSVGQTKSDKFNCGNSDSGSQIGCDKLCDNNSSDSQPKIEKRFRDNGISNSQTKCETRFRDNSTSGNRAKCEKRVNCDKGGSVRQTKSEKRIHSSVSYLVDQPKVDKRLMGDTVVGPVCPTKRERKKTSYSQLLLNRKAVEESDGSKTEISEVCGDEGTPRSKIHRRRRNLKSINNSSDMVFNEQNQKYTPAKEASEIKNRLLALAAKISSSSSNKSVASNSPKELQTKKGLAAGKKVVETQKDVEPKTIEESKKEVESTRDVTVPSSNSSETLGLLNVTCIKLGSPKANKDFISDNIKQSSPKANKDVISDNIKLGSPKANKDFISDNFKQSSPKANKDFIGDKIRDLVVLKVNTILDTYNVKDNMKNDDDYDTGCTNIKTNIIQNTQCLESKQSGEVKGVIRARSSSYYLASKNKLYRSLDRHTTRPQSPQCQSTPFQYSRSPRSRSQQPPTPQFKSSEWINPDFVSAQCHPPESKYPQSEHPEFQPLQFKFEEPENPQWQHPESNLQWHSPELTNSQCQPPEPQNLQFQPPQPQSQPPQPHFPQSQPPESQSQRCQLRNQSLRSHSPRVECLRSNLPQSQPPQSKPPPSPIPMALWSQSQPLQSQHPQYQPPQSKSIQYQYPRSQSPRPQSPQYLSPEPELTQYQSPRLQSPRSQSPRYKQSIRTRALRSQSPLSHPPRSQTPLPQSTLPQSTLPQSTLPHPQRSRSPRFHSSRSQSPIHVSSRTQPQMSTSLGSRSPGLQYPRSQTPKPLSPRSQTSQPQSPQSKSPTVQLPHPQTSPLLAPQSQSPLSLSPRYQLKLFQSPRSHSTHSQFPRSQSQKLQTPRSQSAKSPSPRTQRFQSARLHSPTRSLWSSQSLRSRSPRQSLRLYGSRPKIKRTTSAIESKTTGPRSLTSKVKQTSPSHPTKASQLPPVSQNKTPIARTDQPPRSVSPRLIAPSFKSQSLQFRTSPISSSITTYQKSNSATCISPDENSRITDGPEQEACKSKSTTGTTQNIILSCPPPQSRSSLDSSDTDQSLRNVPETIPGSLSNPAHLPISLSPCPSSQGTPPLKSPVVKSLINHGSTDQTLQSQSPTLKTISHALWCTKQSSDDEPKNSISSPGSVGTSESVSSRASSKIDWKESRSASQLRERKQGWNSKHNQDRKTRAATTKISRPTKIKNRRYFIVKANKPKPNTIAQAYAKKDSDNLNIAPNQQNNFDGDKVSTEEAKPDKRLSKDGNLGEPKTVQFSENVEKLQLKPPPSSLKIGEWRGADSSVHSDNRTWVTDESSSSDMHTLVHSDGSAHSGLRKDHTDDDEEQSTVMTEILKLPPVSSNKRKVLTWVNTPNRPDDSGDVSDSVMLEGWKTPELEDEFSDVGDGKLLESTYRKNAHNIAHLPPQIPKKKPVSISDKSKKINSKWRAKDGDKVGQNKKNKGKLNSKVLDFIALKRIKANGSPVDRSYINEGSSVDGPLLSEVSDIESSVSLQQTTAQSQRSERMMKWTSKYQRPEPRTGRAESSVDPRSRSRSPTNKRLRTPFGTFEGDVQDREYTGRKKRKEKNSLRRKQQTIPFLEELCSNMAESHTPLKKRIQERPPIDNSIPHWNRPKIKWERRMSKVSASPSSASSKDTDRGSNREVRNYTKETPVEYVPHNLSWAFSTLVSSFTDAQAKVAAYLDSVS